LRIVEPLDDPRVHDPVDRLASLLDRRGDLVGDVLSFAGDADADRRRLALVHRRADHAAGVEGELQVRGEIRVGIQLGP
jgi:hypothetical protein